MVRLQPLHERMNAEAQREVEDQRAVFDEEIFVARAPVADGDAVRRGRRAVLDGVFLRRLAAFLFRRLFPDEIHDRTPFCIRQIGQRFNGAILLQLARIGLGESHAVKAHGVTGLELPDFPKLALHDTRRADEAAKARAIGAEDDRHIPREIDSTDGVGVIVDVRRMQARFAAVGPRPLRLRADEPDAGAVRVVVNFPRRREKRGDVIVGEKVGRTVRAVEHADFPVVRVGGDEAVREPGVERRTLGAFRASPPCPPNFPSVKVARLPRYRGT